ncbi:putative DD41D transposase [Trichonephila clavipes]|nr:putative DD41D transposase [Trichonephila clavipes]
MNKKGRYLKSFPPQGEAGGRERPNEDETGVTSRGREGKNAGREGLTAPKHVRKAPKTQYRSLSRHYFPRWRRFNSCQVIYSQFGLAIHQNDQARRRFVEWAQNETAVVPDFHKRILFSDEAHFWLNGYVNEQNCRICSEANPQVATITNFFIPELNNHDVQELWFQQDGATYHTARATIDLLKDAFGDRLISRFGPVNWPPRSCDLTPLDYFLWGYVKSLVYADKPQTLDHLEDNICRYTATNVGKIIENWTSRLDYIRASRGSPMPEIIFKM